MSADGDLRVGIDMGTQGIRVVVVDDDGHTCGRGAEPLTSRRDGVRHEQDADEWWTAVAAACRQALAGLDATRVAGLAVDGTSGTVLLTDRTGAAVTPALMYDDGRAVDEAVTVNEAGRQVWARLGYQSMQRSWGLPKLAWLLRGAATPGDVQLAHQPDFVTRRLIGRPVPTDASHALKTGYDTINECWPLDVFDALGIPESVLVPVVRSGTVLGTVCAAASEVTSLAAGTPVMAGMTDGCASQLAAGAREVGAWNCVLGTTLVLKGVSEELVLDPLGVLYSHRGPGDTWLPGGASSSGAGVVSERFGGHDLDALTRQIARGAPRAVAYPLVSNGGERFPFRAPDAERFVIGDVASDAELLHAFMLGLASVERLCFDYLDLMGLPHDGRITFTGGGARNDYWTQLRADMLGRQVSLPENADGAYGMAVLAASAGPDSGARAARMVRMRATFTPDVARHRDALDWYMRIVTEFDDRRWLQPGLAAHAKERASS